jgi:hypothetical protein
MEWRMSDIRLDEESLENVFIALRKLKDSAGLLIFIEYKTIFKAEFIEMFPESAKKIVEGGSIHDCTGI